jgi:DNA-binding response OmpR family regulator
MPRTVLLADDSVTIRRVVELSFLETDIRVEAVATGREALERLDRTRPDLVLADVVMPEPTGYDICRAVKASPHPVPVLLLAGTFEPFDHSRARDCGADGHLVKPFDSRTLVARVEALLSRERPVSRPIPDVPEPSSEPAIAADANPEDVHMASLIEDLDSPSDETARSRDELETNGVASDSEPPPDGAAREVPLTGIATAHDTPKLSEDDVQRIARAAVALLSDETVREIAWEVVPDLAEAIVRERIRQLEREDAEVG